MRFPGKGRSIPVEIQKTALNALATVIEGGRDAAKDAANDAGDKKRRGTAVRGFVAGAAAVTVGRAAYKGGRFVRDRFSRDDDEPEAREDEEYEDEPEAEGEEDFEEEDEPEAEA